MVKISKVTNFDSFQQGTHQCVQQTIHETETEKIVITLMSIVR